MGGSVISEKDRAVVIQQRRTGGMNKEVSEVRRPMYVVNFLLLATHVLLLVFFALTHIWFMAFVNICSVATYLFLFTVLQKDKTRAYIVIMVAEIIIHMLLAVICVGWNSGFWLYFYGCMGMVFYADYFVSRAKLQRVNTILLSVICAASLFACLAVSKWHNRVYVLEDITETGLIIVNITTNFTFIAVLLWIQVANTLRYQGELEKQANHDRLTGLVNRNYLIEYLQTLQAEADLADYWLAIIDIDDFKGINDTYGHNGGDYVLQKLAELLEENCGGMKACRWGGEEFILVGRTAECVTQEDASACDVLERVREAIDAYDFVYEGQKIHVTITIGSAVHMKFQTIDDWINVADKKLYLGKQTGKNKLVY